MPHFPTSYSEYGIPIRNLWHMLLYAWNEPVIQNQVSMGDVERAPSLDALLAIILMKLIQQRMRIGLGHGYVPASGRLRAVRGRVDFAESLKQQTFVHGEANCDFQQYSLNEPRNQIIRSTLARLIQLGKFGHDEGEAEALRHQLRWLVRNLNRVDMTELTLDSVRRLALAQNDNDYRLMLTVCELILMRQMPFDVDGTHPLPSVDRDTLILYRVYERFVANFYRMHLKGWDVHAQKRLDWHAQEANSHLPSMIPDLLLRERRSGRIVILDTKFTASSLVENQWGKAVYDSAHLYQLYAYLRSQEQLSAEYRSAEGILLYPTVQNRLSERIQLQDHMIRIESVDLIVRWDDVENQLLELIEPRSPGLSPHHPDTIS
jgi:5-methylcytosine-specific restriction enzyme subunit McrC